MLTTLAYDATIKFNLKQQQEKHFRKTDLLPQDVTYLLKKSHKHTYINCATVAVRMWFIYKIPV